MGLHMVAIAKLHLLLSGHGLSPVVGGLALPLTLKFLQAFRFFREALRASRQFFFRLGQIAFGRTTNSHRLERVIRLIYQTINHNLTPQPPPDVILAFSMLAV
ncbi:hypothetical protein L6164_028092 [Bauhinia variegata]|uniref:Uncharacterized protein n=1 Tax=Bauhinia variegata TaxID=167791 RepID=A0ACB9LWM8_BAUVA|nr:hypothetical protein L6164_028092 [Bauhinia variegata]